jgi:hypothetical protein
MHPESFSGRKHSGWASWSKPVATRRVLEAVLWILNIGALSELQTVHRRFQTWCREEVLRRVLTDVASELRDGGALDG